MLTDGGSNPPASTKSKKVILNRMAFFYGGLVEAGDLNPHPLTTSSNHAINTLIRLGGLRREG